MEHKELRPLINPGGFGRLGSHRLPFFFLRICRLQGCSRSGRERTGKAKNADARSGPQRRSRRRGVALPVPSEGKNQTAGAKVPADAIVWAERAAGLPEATRSVAGHARFFVEGEKDAPAAAGKESPPNAVPPAGPRAVPGKAAPRSRRKWSFRRLRGHICQPLPCSSPRG